MTSQDARLPIVTALQFPIDSPAVALGELDQLFLAIRDRGGPGQLLELLKRLTGHNGDECEIENCYRPAERNHMCAACADYEEHIKPLHVELDLALERGYEAAAITELEGQIAGAEDSVEDARADPVVRASRSDADRLFTLLVLEAGADPVAASHYHDAVRYLAERSPAGGVPDDVGEALAMDLSEPALEWLAHTPVEAVGAVLCAAVEQAALDPHSAVTVVLHPVEA